MGQLRALAGDLTFISIEEGFNRSALENSILACRRKSDPLPPLPRPTPYTLNRPACMRHVTVWRSDSPV